MAAANSTFVTFTVFLPDLAHEKRSNQGQAMRPHPHSRGVSVVSGRTISEAYIVRELSVLLVFSEKHKGTSSQHARWISVILFRPHHSDVRSRMLSRFAPPSWSIPDSLAKLTVCKRALYLASSP